jgi:hypothetical protein
LGHGNVVLNTVRDVVMKGLNNQYSCFHLKNKDRCVQGRYKQVHRKPHSVNGYNSDRWNLLPFHFRTVCIDPGAGSL